VEFLTSLICSKNNQVFLVVKEIVYEIWGNTENLSFYYYFEAGVEKALSFL